MSNWYKHIVIGLAGRARSGKDTAAEELINGHGYKKMTFAGPIKKLALLIDPVIDATIEEKVVGRNWWGGKRVERVTLPVRVSHALANAGFETLEEGESYLKENFPEYRRFLQHLGTDAREVLGENVWVDRLIREIRAHDGNVVVTDVRFPNEVEALDSLETDDQIRVVDTLRIVRASADSVVDAHPSEALVDTLIVDGRIENEGSPEDLWDEVGRRASALEGLRASMVLEGQEV